ncbi:hypothetical protein [Paraburkholderia sp. JHI869]|uniref:hypothetical protein n=1 Tax=Paraburkholderia sp. JHI869 TaxID=3112959 RepID=UPI00317050DF
MTSEEFHRMLAVYGTNIERWPEETRHDALLRLGSLTAREKSNYHRTKLLDALLDSVYQPSVGEMMEEKVMATIPHPLQPDLKRRGRWIDVTLLFIALASVAVSLFVIYLLESPSS